MGDDGGRNRGFVRRRIDPDARFGLRLTLLAVAFLLVAVPFGLLLRSVGDRDGRLVSVDRGVVASVHRVVVRHPGWVKPLEVLTFLGKPVFLAVVCVLVGAALVWRRRYRLAAFLVGTVLSGGVLDTVVKSAVRRPRPILEHPISSAQGWSFPSGHAMSATICYGAAVVVLLPMVAGARRRALIGSAVALVALIAASRIALGVHFLSDVVGGVVLGGAWLLAATGCFWEWRREETPVGASPDADLPEAVSEGEPSGTR